MLEAYVSTSNSIHSEADPQVCNSRTNCYNGGYFYNYQSTAHLLDILVSLLIHKLIIIYRHPVEFKIIDARCAWNSVHTNALHEWPCIINNG